MTDKQNDAPSAHDLGHYAQSFFLKLYISDGQHFIDHENIGLEVRGDRESEPHVHSARVALYRRIEKFLDICKANYLIEFSLYFCATHAEDRTIEKYVFASGQFRMKAGANFQQARDPPLHGHTSFRRFGDSRQYFQQRALAGTITADDPHHVAPL